MAQYAHKVILYTTTDNVAGLGVAQNNADLADYTTNYRANTVKASNLLVAETTFNIDLSYTDFKAKIVSPLTWGDVREITLPGRYELYLVSGSPL